MQIIFLGTPQFAVPSLEKLLEHPAFEVLAVVTQPDKRRGRGINTIPSPVKKIALEHQLPVWQPVRIKKDLETLEKLQTSKADVFVVVAYGQILSPQILAMPKLGCVNVHGSLLPQYRGAAPIQWSIYNGDQETGVTTMLIDEGMDTGPMLLKTYTPISLFDNAHDIAAKLAQQGADLLIETLLKLEQGKIDPIPQDLTLATYTRLIDKSDYVIDWSRPALAIHNQVRGFYPHCVTSFKSQPLKIIATLPITEAREIPLPPDLAKLESQWQELTSLSGTPGEVIKIIKNLGLAIQTGEGLLLVLEVQLAGKRVQSAWDFVNGTHLEVGEKFISNPVK
jgi:methionyl-tRNA formyltransferase